MKQMDLSDLEALTGTIVFHAHYSQKSSLRALNGKECGQHTNVIR